MRCATLGLLVACPTAILLGPAAAAAEPVCGTVDAFNQAMADAGTTATEVTLTFDVVGVNPGDFAGSKGSLAQMRNTTCAAGQDAVIKVYGPEDPPNVAHPSGTLKLEHGNACCGGECGEQWADPNASAVVFVDGTEQCAVSMWITPTEVGYSLDCNVGQFDALGENPLQNTVDGIALLDYVLPDGGTTWGLPNATASNDEVCWVAMPSDGTSVTVPVLEDVTAAPSTPDAVFADVTDLAVEAGDNEAYLKFEVPPVDGKITRARLFMHTSTAPSSDGDGGEVHALTDNGWSEATLTWNTRPAYAAASLGRIGPAAADLLVSLDLGEAIAGGGTYGFAVVSPPTDGNGTHFWSKEGSPGGAAYLQLDVVVVDGDGDGTPDGPDCDDTDPDIGPDADEVCNGVDDDCDGEIDEGCGGADDGGSSGVASTGPGDTGLGSGGADGPGLPGDAGARGGDTGCACTTSREASPTWLVIVGVVRMSRRRRASITPRTAGPRRSDP